MSDPIPGATDGYKGIYDYYSKGLQKSVGDQKEDVAKSLSKLDGLQGDELSVALAQVNFKVGQFNALMELTSNLGKNMSDTLKSICQKV